jgi:hypothetical protein
VRSESFSVDKAVGVFKFLTYQVIDHLRVLYLLLPGLRDSLLLGCIVDVPVRCLKILGLLFKLRLGNLLRLECQIEGLGSALHVAVAANLVLLELVILLVLACNDSVFFTFILDQRRGTEEEVEGVCLT